MIESHKEIYNIFVSGIYHKPHSIFKSRSQEFLNSKIGIFSGNDTRITSHFMVMHIDTRMQKFLQYTILYA